jgi:hypothetical protein
LGEAGGEGEPPNTDPRANANFFRPPILVVGLVGLAGLVGEVGLPIANPIGDKAPDESSGANGLLGSFGLGLITLLRSSSPGMRVGETGSECVDVEGKCQCPNSAPADDEDPPDPFDDVHPCACALLLHGRDAPPREGTPGETGVGDDGDVDVLGENGDERLWDRRKPGGGGKAEMSDWRQCVGEWCVEWG